MRINAFLLINTEPDSEGEVLQSLKEIEGVKEAYSVYGVYDIVAKVEANRMDELKDVVSLMRRLNVRTVLTLIVNKNLWKKVYDKDNLIELGGD